MCKSTVDIKSATAEIRRGKKEEKRNKKKQHQNIIVRICYAGRPYNNKVNDEILSVWDVNIQTDHMIEYRRPDIVVV